MKKSHFLLDLYNLIHFRENVQTREGSRSGRLWWWDEGALRQASLRSTLILCSFCYTKKIKEQLTRHSRHRQQPVYAGIAKTIVVSSVETDGTVCIYDFRLHSVCKIVLSLRYHRPPLHGRFATVESYDVRTDYFILRLRLVVPKREAKTVKVRLHQRWWMNRKGASIDMYSMSVNFVYCSQSLSFSNPI